MYSKIIQKNDPVTALSNIELEKTINSINILVVEDEPEIADRIIEVLEESANLTNLPPRSYRKAYNGLKALHSLIEEDKAGWFADLVVSDISMPIIDGPGIVHKLRNDEKYRKFSSIPVILISSYVDNNEEKIEIYKKTGAEFVFFKDLDDKTLWFMFNTTLRLVAKEKLLYKKNQIISQQNEELEKKQEETEKELALALEVQQKLLPKEPPQTKKIDFHYICKQMKGVGGDFIQTFHLASRDDKLGIFICDVSGHGTAAGQLASMIHAIVNSSHIKEFFFLKNEPAEAFVAIKKQINNHFADHFFTAYMVYLDLDSGVLTFARAGHPKIGIIRNDGTIEFISSVGRMINDDPDPVWAVNSEKVSIQLEVGDRILLYTDGLLEANTPTGEMIKTEENLKQWLINNNINFKNCAKDICSEILEKLFIFTGNNQLDDDIIISVTEIKKLKKI